MTSAAFLLQSRDEPWRRCESARRGCERTPVPCYVNRTASPVDGDSGYLEVGSCHHLEVKTADSCARPDCHELGAWKVQRSWEVRHRIGCPIRRCPDCATRSVRDHHVLTWLETLHAKLAELIRAIHIHGRNDLIQTHDSVHPQRSDEDVP